ncbi:hypothetical protein QYM36_004075 [Artemia franciscana]|uniref:Uncharacterized protein n=1 Tax=Artemia franciscana TaxID=6661 RepID=A0AA88I554_ARTSF|nr:hypothetical protein QYM36_004075 [Artemia franciscana]
MNCLTIVFGVLVLAAANGLPLSQLTEESTSAESVVNTTLDETSAESVPKTTLNETIAESILKPISDATSAETVLNTTLNDTPDNVLRTTLNETSSEAVLNSNFDEAALDDLEPESRDESQEDSREVLDITTPEAELAVVTKLASENVTTAEFASENVTTTTEGEKSMFKVILDALSNTFKPRDPVADYGVDKRDISVEHRSDEEEEEEEDKLHGLETEGQEEIKPESDMQLQTEIKNPEETNPDSSASVVHNNSEKEVPVPTFDSIGQSQPNPEDEAKESNLNGGENEENSEEKIEDSEPENVLNEEEEEAKELQSLVVKSFANSIRFRGSNFAEAKDESSEESSEEEGSGDLEEIEPKQTPVLETSGEDIPKPILPDTVEGAPVAAPDTPVAAPGASVAAPDAPVALPDTLVASPDEPVSINSYYVRVPDTERITQVGQESELNNETSSASENSSRVGDIKEETNEGKVKHI